jgi:16S rRNA (adenine1518-N6/adenine1519-N6)-dimethyltransferase
MNYESRAEIMTVLRQQGIALKKRWGQNFLINHGAREKIAGMVAAAGHETVWEIGPGLGALTVLLLAHARRLIAFEIDRGLVHWLTQEFAGHNRLTICQGDVLKTWPGVFKTYGMPHKICGNLPYNSASAIILSFIMRDFSPPRMVFTVQRELARPDVFSSIIILIPRKRLHGARERDWFFRLVKTGFASRRKTFKNNILRARDLNPAEKQNVLSVLGRAHSLNTLRAEELGVDQIIDLARESMA